MAASEATYDALNGLAAKALNSEEKFRYFFAMFDALDPKLAEQSIKLSLSTALPPLVTNRALAAVAANEHVALVWGFAKQNGAALQATIDGFERNRYFANIVASSTDAALADDLETYVKTNLPPDAITEAQRTGEAIRLRASLQARLLQQLADTLK